MLGDTGFLEYLIFKYGGKNTVIHITDSGSMILASTEQKRVGTKSKTAQYIIQTMRPAAIENPEPENGGWDYIYGSPILCRNEPEGTVIVRGKADEVQATGGRIKGALESALEYAWYGRQRDNPDDESRIARAVLTGQAAPEEMRSLINRRELDPDRLRSVICLSLGFHQTNYFNINLNLGYQSGTEKIRGEVLAKLRKNRYLNSQDMVFQYNNNTMVIIKSFLPVPDHSRIYMALDKICGGLEIELRNQNALSFGIAYGNLCYGMVELQKSFNEAMEIINIGQSIGQSAKPEGEFYILEHILFDHVCHYLNPQIMNKLIEPALAKLTKPNGSLREEVITCAEAVIDDCMSLSRTSQRRGWHRNTISSRLERLKLLTGLDPLRNFSDAFIIKMLAVSARRRSRQNS
jgi:carbohydrate diacid regulator